MVRYRILARRRPAAHVAVVAKEYPYEVLVQEVLESGDCRSPNFNWKGDSYGVACKTRRECMIYGNGLSAGLALLAPGVVQYANGDAGVQFEDIPEDEE